MIKQLYEGAQVWVASLKLDGVTGRGLLEFYEDNQEAVAQQHRDAVATQRQVREQQAVDAVTRIARNVVQGAGTVAGMLPMRWSRLASRVTGVPSQADILLDLAVQSGMRLRHAGTVDQGVHEAEAVGSVVDPTADSVADRRSSKSGEHEVAA